MNNFETRANALRLRFKAERILIQKECARRVGHLNTAIGQVSIPEAADLLRAEKHRVKEAARQSMAWNRLCYREQLSLIIDEMQQYYAANPSRSSLRRSAV